MYLISFSYPSYRWLMLLTVDWLEMPCALILLIVVAPSFFASWLRGSWVGLVILIIIGCYLLQEHIRASGGFKNSFTKQHGISNTIGIILLFVYPVWALILDILWATFRNRHSLWSRVYLLNLYVCFLWVNCLGLLLYFGCRVGHNVCSNFSVCRKINGVYWRTVFQ